MSEQLVSRNNVESYRHERNKSFDVLSSVDLYRHDLQTVGYIRPETQHRVYEEELVYIAEGINRPLYTETHIKSIDGQLSFFDQGKYQSYISTLIRALDIARQEARQDPRKNFYVERAAMDLQIGYQLQMLKPGEKIRWYADFPDRENELYGENFIGTLGYQAGRRMGFLNEAEAINGGVVLRCQSVDNSDQEAFEAALAEDNIEGMRRAYDTVLAKKHAAFFFAGRRTGNQPEEENAWSVVTRHKDLLETFYFSKIKDLAQTRAGSRSELERSKKQLTYGVWAALKKRMERQAVNIDGPVYYEQNVFDYGVSIQREVDYAYAELALRGEVLFGCGGSISGEQTLLEASPAHIFEVLFGKKSEKKWMSCPFCGARQFGDPCATSIKCSDCSAEVNSRGVKSTGNGGARARQKSTKAVQTQQETDWQRIKREDKERKAIQKQQRAVEIMRRRQEINSIGQRQTDQSAPSLAA